MSPDAFPFAADNRFIHTSWHKDNISHVKIRGFVRFCKTRGESEKVRPRNKNLYGRSGNRLFASDFKRMLRLLLKSVNKSGKQKAGQKTAYCSLLTAY